LQLITINDTYTHTHTHTHSVALLWKKDRPVAQDAYLTGDIHNRHTSMPPVGFEPAILASALRRPTHYMARLLGPVKQNTGEKKTVPLTLSPKWTVRGPNPDL